MLENDVELKTFNHYICNVEQHKTISDNIGVDIPYFGLTTGKWITVTNNKQL